MRGPLTRRFGETNARLPSTAYLPNSASSSRPALAGPAEIPIGWAVAKATRVPAAGGLEHRHPPPVASHRGGIVVADQLLGSSTETLEAKSAPPAAHRRWCGRR